MTAPKPRWLRFGLRTLFIVVTVVGILGWWLRANAIQVRQRKELLAYLQGLDHQPSPVPTWVIRWDDDEARIPTLWRWMGATNEDWGTWLLCNVALTDEVLEQAKRLLPDTEIQVVEKELRHANHKAATAPATQTP